MFFKLRSFKKNLVILIENNIRIKKNSGYKTSKFTKKIVLEIIFLNYFKKYIILIKQIYLNLKSLDD